MFTFICFETQDNFSRESGSDNFRSSLKGLIVVFSIFITVKFLSQTFILRQPYSDSTPDRIFICGVRKYTKKKLIKKKIVNS